MKRTVVALFLALAAVALLASLVFESRSIPVEMHIAHNAAITELERIAEDHRSLVTAIGSASASGQSPGEGARVLRERLADGPRRLEQQLPRLRGGASEQNRLGNNFERFTSMVDQASRLADELIAEQNLYAANLAQVREEGPRLVQQMRDLRLDSPAADTFALVAGTLDFAGSPTSMPPAELQRLLVTLQRDQRIDANMPTQMQQLRSQIEDIFRTKPLIESRLSQLAATPVAQSAGNLHAAARDLYASAVSRTDQARVTLSVYAVLLFGAAGFIAFRLHQSYRALNQANSELEQLNQSLEQRVTERTEKLAGTLQELKESQVQLVQAEKMSSLGQLVAGISHEINTPLLYLTNNAELIQERLEIAGSFVQRCNTAFSIRPEQFEDRAAYQTKFIAELKEVKRALREEDFEASMEEARDLARDSVEGLAQLTEIAQGLKDFSRLDRAPVASFDVNGGLDKTLLIAKNIIKHKAEVHKYYGELPEIECSPSQINQVFLNLITNAAQAIVDQGQIVITTALRDDRSVAVTIADTGCGIAAEHLDKIRDPFFTTKEVGKGTGLGLSIVDEIIRSHGGRLTVESEPGKGSAFTVVLPIRRAGSRDGALDPLSDMEVDGLLETSAGEQSLAEAV